jgi:hypothetical protein
MNAAAQLPGAQVSGGWDKRRWTWEIFPTWEWDYVGLMGILDRIDPKHEITPHAALAQCGRESPRSAYGRIFAKYLGGRTSCSTEANTLWLCRWVTKAGGQGRLRRCFSQ